MPLLENIKTALEAAAITKTKTSTFHSLVLIHSDELENVAASEFCHVTGLKNSYQIEFRKMLAASRKLRELGYTIEKHSRNTR